METYSNLPFLYSKSRSESPVFNFPSHWPQEYCNKLNIISSKLGLNQSLAEQSFWRFGPYHRCGNQLQDDLTTLLGVFSSRYWSILIQILSYIIFYNEKECWRVLGPSSDGIGKKLLRFKKTQISWLVAGPWTTLVLGDKITKNIY